VWKLRFKYVKTALFPFSELLMYVTRDSLLCHGGLINRGHAGCHSVETYKGIV